MPIYLLGNRYDGSSISTLYLAVQVDGGDEDREAVLKLLNTPKPGCDGHYSAIDITDNELAKSHTRFLVGGKSHTVKDEVMRVILNPKGCYPVFVFRAARYTCKVSD